MAISHLLTKLSNEMNSTVGALDLPEGTNYSDIARMAVEGEISTGGEQFREIEFENNYCDESFEGLSENDETTLLALLEYYESGDSDLILIRYIENAEGNPPDIASIRVSDFNGEKGAFIYTLSGTYSIDYTPNSTYIQPMWGNITWRDADTDLQTQYSWIPEPSEDWVGRIIQYTDNIEPGFVKGNFYECVGDWSGDDPVFTWEHIDVQESSPSLNLKWVWQGYPDDSVQRLNFDQMEKGTYLLSVQYSRNNNGVRLNYYKKNGSQAEVAVEGTDFPYATTAIYITNPISEAPANPTSTFMIFGSADICNLNDGVIYNKRLKYTFSDGTVSLSNDNSTPVIHYLTEKAQTIAGVKTFSSIPAVSSYTAPTTNTQLVAKQYVDDVASNFLATDNTTSFTPVGDYNPSTKKYVDDTVYGVNSYMTSGDPKLIGYYNGRNIWRKTFEYTQSTIQNWTVETQASDFATYLVQLPTDYDNVEFVINSHADADVYLSSLSTSVDISNTFDPLDPIMSCQLLQFIKSGPDGHQYFRLLLGDDVKDHANKISVTIEWIEAQVVIA